jgi:hypothetical protein
LQTLAAALLLASGVMLLGRSRIAIVLLRWGAAASIVLSFVGIAMALRDGTSYRSLWSTPGAGAYQGLELFQRLWPPLLMVMLTLPPLARRL